MLRSTLFVTTLVTCSVLYADGWDPTTNASNVSSIINTRHNLTVSFNPIARGIMESARNDYIEICVYCHTPHGANKQIDAPLWNRTISITNYEIYNKPRSLNRPISQPGPNSLTCLSCHDGTISIDSIINMPGSGGYNEQQETSVNANFLDSWTGPGNDGRHYVLGPGNSQPFRCTTCHNSFDPNTPDYNAFVIGKDLRNDHPIAILYPDTFSPDIDFNIPDVEIVGKMKFFDVNANQLPDTNEVRLYTGANGATVECASCHDPHGVESGVSGSKFNPTFLRVNNAVLDNGTVGTSGIISNGPSALCLTCHTK